MAELYEPCVTALFLISQREAQKPGKRLPYLTFEDTAGPDLRSEVGADGCRRSIWPAANGETTRLDWSLAHDTHILRLSLSRSGPQPASSWSDLNRGLEEILNSVHSSSDQPLPWAATRVFTAQAARAAKTEELQGLIAQLSRVVAGPVPPGAAEPTPFGWCWSLGAKELSIGADHRLWQRWLAWVVPQERAERVEAVFLQPLNQGLARIELYLHKSLHHARQHDAVRAALENARVELQEGMLVALRTVSFKDIQREEPELEKISRKLMIFLAEKTQTEVLLNSLRSNQKSYLEHLERVRLETPSYASQAALIQRGIEQLESDLANAQAVAESSYTFQDIQRSIESNRIERAGVLLGGAAAILAGLAIFNNFLDIWNLSVEKSSMILPDPWLRALLGALAAVFWPLGAYQLVQRKWWRGGISLLIGVLSIILAVVFTVLVNS
jgi:hypothetical protein